MIVCRATGGNAKLRFPEFWNVSGARRKQHRLFDVVLVHDLEPELNLLGRAHIAVVTRITKSIEEIGVKGLVRRPEARVAPIPRRLKVFANVALTFEHMPIGIDYWRPVSHRSFLLLRQGYGESERS